MSKQLLSFVCLSVLTLVYPNYRALANATEDSDRQFLEQLESGAAPQANPAPTTRVIPAPNPAASPADSSATKPHVVTADPSQPPKSATVVKRSSDSMKPSKKVQDRVPQLPEVADGDLQTAVVPMNVTTVTADSDSDRDHDRHHHFFRRLFRGLFKNNNGHPEDW